MSENIELENLNPNNETTAENNNNDNVSDNPQNENIETDNKQPDNTIYGAPETYDYTNIKLPDGYEYDKDMLKEFDALNKETNLSQAQANKYMEFGLKLAQKQSGSVPAILKQVQQAKITQYQQALNTDEEIGGGDKTKMNAYLDVADKGYTAFAGDDVKSALAEAGLNYHPAIIKMFHRIGKLIGDDKIYSPKTPSGTAYDAADILYGTNN